MRAPPIPNTDEGYNAFAESYSIELENEFLGFNLFNSYTSKILDAKYEKVNARDATPLFYRTNKHRRVCLFSDPRAQYKYIKRKQYPLPNIQDVQRKKRRL